MFELLGPDLAADVTWRANNTPAQSCDMERLFATQDNIHKAFHYLPVYESTFGPYRDRPIRMLEIGVSLGGSLELWRRYLHPESTIVGVDMNANCAQFDDPTTGIRVRVGEQQDRDFLASLVNEFGRFDIVLDDGSHWPGHQWASFQYLFGNGLADGGVYVVEDLFSCYLPAPFNDPVPDGTPLFMDMVKMLIDVMHEHYRRVAEGFDAAFEPAHPGHVDEYTVPQLTTLISRIEIHDSMAAIHRGPRLPPRFVRRWSPERMASVVGVKESAAIFRGNPWILQGR